MSVKEYQYLIWRGEVIEESDPGNTFSCGPIWAFTFLSELVGQWPVVHILTATFQASVLISQNFSPGASNQEKNGGLLIYFLSGRMGKIFEGIIFQRYEALRVSRRPTRSFCKHSKCSPSAFLMVRNLCFKDCLEFCSASEILLR